MHITKVLFIASLATVALAAAEARAGTKFYAYEGRDAVRDGVGGAKDVVDGVDFWLEGTPPHRYQLVGVINDERLKSGLIGMISMAQFKHDIAKRVRNAGGDAVILTNSQDNVVGMTSTSFGNASGAATSMNGTTNFAGYGSSSSWVGLVKHQQAHFFVIKYLPDPAAAPAAPGQPTPAPAQAQ